MTQMPLIPFAGAAKRLDDIDLPRIGKTIGVGEDEIHAIIDTETAGSGFDGAGRPRMLFEPHVFYRLLNRGGQAGLLARASAMGLAYPKWGTQPYPRDSYPRLEQAMLLDRQTAMQSASWGLGQIMGFNCVMAGYTTVEAMVDAFMEDEEHQLEAMITFIVNAGLATRLRMHDWVGFARGYNGPGFAQNGYDKKLAASFARWQKIKDTPLLTGD